MRGFWLLCGLARHPDDVVSLHFSPRLQQPSQAASFVRSEWQHERGSQSVATSLPAFALHGWAMYFVVPPRGLSSPVRALWQP